MKQFLLNNTGNVDSDKLTIKDIFTTIGTALIIVMIFNVFFLYTKVSGDSMYPTLKHKEHLIFYKIPVYRSNYKHKDIVVFKQSEDQYYVKRIIGLPGDKIKISEGDVFVNDKKQEEPYINEQYTMGEVDLTVPKDCLFVLGDNRQHSNDSRFEEVGCVKFSQVSGIKHNKAD